MDAINEGPLEMSEKRRRIVLVGVLVGMFIAALEATVVGTAMPTVIASLGGMNHYSWVFSAYLVTSTVTVPVWGKLSDLYGRRLLYQIGIGVFLLGTLLSGMSATMTQLIIFRAIQGLGAGALVPLGMTIIGDIYTMEQRARMQALFSGVWGLSSVIGPIVGGFITDQMSWRWVFFVNLPVGVAAAIIIGAALKEPKVTKRPTIDYAGATLLMVAISLLMLVLVESGAAADAFFDPLNIGLLIAAVALFAAFIYVENRAADPIIPFELFRNRTITVAVVVGFLAGIAMFGAISFIPLFAQGALGSTATEAGSLLTPLMLSWVTMSVIGGRLMLKFSFRNITLVGFVILAFGFYLLAGFDRSTPRIWLYVDLMFIGAGLGLTMLTLLIAVQESVERPKLGIATSLNQFSRSIGGAFGVAIMGTILMFGMSSNLRKVSTGENALLTPDEAAAFASNPNALIEPEARAQLSPELLDTLQEVMGESISTLFGVGSGIAVLAFFATWFLPINIRRDARRRAIGSERMIMAGQTNINARNQPSGKKETADVSDHS